MPFTPSHAVVALPFIRTPLVPAAIAVGAMAPDLPLFVRGIGIRYSATHDLIWLPATVLLALVLLLVWRCILRSAARELSPTWLGERLPASWDAGAKAAFRETFASAIPTPRAPGAEPVEGRASERREAEAGPRPSVRGILLLIASLALGVVSHIVWDLFTHEGRWGTQLIPALADFWGPLTGFKWLQHGSSAFGLIVLAVFGILWLSRRHRAPVQRLLPAWLRISWWASLPVLLIAATIWGYITFGPLRPEFRLEHLAYLMLPPACALFGALTLVLALVIPVLRRRRGSV